MAPASSSSGARVVCVWHATVDAITSRSAGAQERAVAVLNPAERVRHGRFRHDDDRHQFLLGRVMARAIVGDALGVPPDAWRWREGPRGRPEIDEPDCPVSFNLAHSAGLVVCAVSHAGPVGVDVEHRERAPIDRALVARCCAANEAADIDAQGDGWRDQFLKYWTLKESYLKAVGLGISVHLPDVRFQLAAGPAPAFTGTLAGADAG
jgi:4'-phosphopantetheinyl transferase